MEAQNEKLLRRERYKKALYEARERLPLNLQTFGSDDRKTFPAVKFTMYIEQLRQQHSNLTDEELIDLKYKIIVAARYLHNMNPDKYQYDTNNDDPNIQY